MSEALLAKPMLVLRQRQTSVKDLLLGMTALGASDLFLKTGSPVRFKISGKVVSFEGDVLTRERMEHVLGCFMLGEERLQFRAEKVADLVYASGSARYRVHFAHGHTGPYAAIRLIEQDIPEFAGLGLPANVQHNLLSQRGGLVVVCGATDAGKTVTCTSLLNEFNQKRQLAILTLEDPIEYVFEDQSSMVLQREIGLHTDSFATGIKAALRENLDVIFVGEMRGLDTIEEVLRASEMGHLVISTLHADDVFACINRVVGSFPPVEQSRIRQSFASVLQGVLFQRLLPTVDGGRAPCIEALWPNTAVRSIIRGGDITKLGSYLGKNAGNQSFRESLQDLLQAGRISREVFTEQMANLPVSG
ncbi:MAG: Flp pilus assembly complex ATPase component TadA [Deltaproteobacteria bacterium]|nr:Flp pilus assembly complex ATPase component TadA [Deltaproteobacteria bacterium]